MGNYRPIIFLYIFSKHLRKHWNQDFKSSTQGLSLFVASSFTKGMSTHDGILGRIMSKTYSAINQSYNSSGLFIDFSNTPDFVDH